MEGSLGKGEVSEAFFASMSRSFWTKDDNVKSFLLFAKAKLGPLSLSLFVLSVLFF